MQCELMIFFNCFADFQKLEREARICRKLQHPNIGKMDFLIAQLASEHTITNDAFK